MAQVLRAGASLGCFSRWVVLAVVSLTAAFGAPARAAEPLRMAVHPYLPTQELLTRFKPLTTYLSQALGRDIQLSISVDYNVHERRLGTGQVDFGYVGPAPYVALSQQYGPQTLLARLEVNGAPTFHGYVVARKDGPVKTLRDMKGKRFAFGAERSTMSHMAPYALLLEAGISKKDLAEYAFVGSHKNVALAVLAGRFDAGGVKEEVYHALKAQGLEGIAKSPPVSEHLFVGTSRLSPADANALREALLSMAGTEEGLRALMALKKTVTALVSVTDADYDPLRAIMRGVQNAP